MTFVGLFAITMVWMYVALRLPNPLYVIAFVVIGLMIPTGVISLAINGGWILYKLYRKGEQVVI